MTDIAWPLIAYIADGRRITEAEAATMVEALRTHTIEQPAPDAAPLADPVAWEGWFGGCGSINSRTVVTRSADLADKWAAQGAKVTPLFDHPAPAPAVPDDVADWRDDPAADERWNAGCDFAMTQLCKVLNVDPHSVSWDAATEELDGDVRSVIGNILTAAFGDDWPTSATIEAQAAELARLTAVLKEIADAEPPSEIWDSSLGVRALRLCARAALTHPTGAPK